MRDFATTFSPPFLSAFQEGVRAYTYKGISCMKCPIDLAIYTKLIWDLRPRSVVEIGTHKGGSALWLADTVSNAGIDCATLSIDLSPAAEFTDPRIAFLAGDAARLEATLTRDRLGRLQHPWLVIEDSAHSHHTTLAVIGFFADTMLPGDVLVVEDGVLDELGLSELYQGGPNRAVGEFLTAYPTSFRIMDEYCDMFGRNATYNPNAYLVKT
jgi:cephalosporin hydroxylase